ncbi:HD-GYP domain-containing protein [Ureibacillus sp. 179-F W5.1 NHS]|uniref:HD-GYP domain-containing protein n=1 Tax=Lysinibacillus halotolerans TaxID=1368476 RepID=A0A3M8H8Y8_9BACI|nr:HD-GYP domain-containing protein [Lysinibacillus halotolerans]RNC98856.1 HD-GYP domain-containing protein [Lysinibacillus halotolerans]
MEATYVNTNELLIGKVVAEDIFANTQFPIIYKNTIITQEHLHILTAFQIANIPVLVDDNAKQSIESNANGNLEVQQVKISFETKFQLAVADYKKLFLGWEAGSKIDITKVRGIILPLVEEFLTDRSILFKLNNISNTKEYLYNHCIATGLIAALITHKLGYNQGYVFQMAIAGTLADSGMAKVPYRIREKKGSLNETEFFEIRKHPLYSFQMVKSLPAIKEEMKLAIYQHHERLDGSGYVDGVKLGKISLFSQAIAIADTFHAMTSDRVYCPKESPFKVIEMIKQSEFGKFDIKVVQTLTDLVARLPIGTQVEVSNLGYGEIIFNNHLAPTRPLIKLINSGEMIDLSKQRDLYISQVMFN